MYGDETMKRSGGGSPQWKPDADWNEAKELASARKDACSCPRWRLSTRERRIRKVSSTGGRFDTRGRYAGEARVKLGEVALVEGGVDGG